MIALRQLKFSMPFKTLPGLLHRAKKTIKSVAKISMATLRNEEISDSEEEGPAPRRSGYAPRSFYFLTHLSFHVGLNIIFLCFVSRPRASRRADPKAAAVNEELASLIGSSTDEDDDDQGESTEKED
jgi:hypothetical protein